MQGLPSTIIAALPSEISVQEENPAHALPQEHIYTPSLSISDPNQAPTFITADQRLRPSPSPSPSTHMEKVTLTGAGASSATIYHFGAHVTSWTDSRGREMIYTSPTALFNGKKAIRGGIPVCFPQFGKEGPLGQHGFARNSFWTYDAAYHCPDGHAAARFVLTDSEGTRAGAWPFRFELALVVTLDKSGDELRVGMTVSNMDDRAFSFTTALHSYFTCDPLATALPEYDGLAFRDNNDPEAKNVQVGDVTFGMEVDRVYMGTSDTLSVPSANLTLSKSNLPEAVVWNPYVEKATALADMPNDGWKNFICIEPARIFEPSTVEPAASWSCSFTMTSAV